MRLQSENAVFKFLQSSVDRANASNSVALGRSSVNYFVTESHAYVD